MYDTRNLTIAQLRERARIQTDDGWMTTSQLRAVTGLSCSAVYAMVRRCKIASKAASPDFSGSSPYPGRLYNCKDVLRAINAGDAPLAQPGARRARGALPSTPSKPLALSLRLSEGDLAALDAVAKRYGLSRSAVIRRLIGVAAQTKEGAIQ